MERASIRRKYKTERPTRTIHKIRNIIYNLGVSLIEEHYDHANSKMHSCRLRIINNGLYDLNYGVNGKGLSPEYSLASAYGELMERLQNGILFYGMEHAYAKTNPSLQQILKAKNIQLKYKYFADEIVCNGDIFKKKYSEYFQKIFYQDRYSDILECVENYFSLRQHTGVFYYNINRHNCELLPYELIRTLVSSNGMCAGNTPYEALMQGLCECFERYAITYIFKHTPILPNIPIEYFEGSDVYEELIKLDRRASLSVLIKDCSLGRGLPVILLVLINRKNNKYFACAGADPSPIIALERCLTEIFQGGTEFKMNELFCKDQTALSTSPQRAYYDTMIMGMGRWPDCIFSIKQYQKPSWRQFNSERENFQYYVDLVINLGYDIYIRDCSNLGFPAYHVYIPGMSEIYFNFNVSEFCSLVAYSNSLNNIKNISEKDERSIENILKSIQLLKIIDTPTRFHLGSLLPPMVYNPYASINISRLQIYVAFRFKNFVLIHQELLKDLQSENPVIYQDRQLENILLDYVSFILEGMSLEEIEVKLGDYYSPRIINELKKELLYIQRLFDPVESPMKCENCMSCSQKINCKLTDLAGIVSKIDDRRGKHLIDQTKLFNLFKYEI